MNATDRSGVIPLSEVRAKLPGLSGSLHVLKRMTLDAKLNCLTPPNELASQAQDEIYVVIDGRGIFVHGEHRDRIEPGDFLFVAAATEHVFVNFENLILWRIYYCPDGAEVPI